MGVPYPPFETPPLFEFFAKRFMVKLRDVLRGACMSLKTNRRNHINCPGFEICGI